MKFKRNVNGVTEATASLWECRPYSRSRVGTCSQRNTAKVSSSMDFGEKDEDVQDEVPQARYFTLKQFSKAHCDIENTKQTMWEAGPNLETRMTTCQGREKGPIPHHITKREQLLLSFSLQKKTF